MWIQILLRTVIATLILISFIGCAGFSNSEFDRGAGSADARQSNLTPGMVKLKIEKGQTTQAEVLEVFGPPDQTTHRNDIQIFTYDKISNYMRADRGGLLFYEAGSIRSSSVSIMLILYFDSNDIVYDYRLDQIKY